MEMGGGGGGAQLLSHIRQTGEAGCQTCDPRVQTESRGQKNHLSAINYE